MKKNEVYTPDRGHIVWLDFNPSRGSEQKGRRPAVILTPHAYNIFGLCYCLPITSKSKGYTIEVKLNKEQNTQGVILTNQMLAIEWKGRQLKYIEGLDFDTLRIIDSRLRTILSL